MGLTGYLPDYDALIKSDPTLYPVGSDITFHCQITLDEEQREQYRPLVDEIDHDTLIPCLERAFVKILRQWSDIRDDNISLEALYEAAARKANVDGRQNLARAKKIYGSITDSIRRDQRELEGVVQVAAAVVSGYLRAEPVREKEIILWVGNSFVFHTLDYLGRQLGKLKPQIITRRDHHDKEIRSQDIALFLPLSSASIRWFTKKYDRQTKKLTDTVSTEYHHFMDEINKGEIDNLLRDIAAKSATIRVFSDDVEAKIVEWRLQFLGSTAWKFSFVDLDGKWLDRSEKELFDRDEASQKIISKGNLSRQIGELLNYTHGQPVYRDESAPQVYLSELQSLFWERIRLTMIKAVLARERHKTCATDNGTNGIDVILATKVSVRYQSKKPFNVLIITKKDTLSFAIYLIIKEYAVNNGIDDLCRPRFLSNDKTLRIDRSLVNNFARFKNLLDSNEIDVSPEMTEQGTDKLSVLTPDMLKEADTIIVDNDETEISVRQRLDTMVLTDDEGKPIIVNIRTLMFNNGIHDYDVFLLNKFCIDILQETLDRTILPTFRGLYNPRDHVLRYNRKRFGAEAQECAQEEIKRWAENSRDPFFHK